MVPSQLQGSRKMATSHGPHQDSSSEWRSADGGHLFAQRASLSAGLLLLLLLLLHSLSVKSRRCITTTFPLSPCATLKCLKIKLQKYFNLLWQHVGCWGRTHHPIPGPQVARSASSLLPMMLMMMMMIMLHLH